MKGVGTTIKEIIANKPMLIYILSYFFYIDGVHTVISMATTYGTNLGLDSTGMMLALLLVQILGLPFCLLYIKCSESSVPAPWWALASACICSSASLRSL